MSANLDKDSEKYKPKTLEVLENYLSKHYEFRRNVVSDRVEFAKKGESFGILNDHSLATLWRDCLRKTSLANLSKDSLDTLFKSDFSPAYNPFQAYFKGLDYDPSKDYIEELASTVCVENSEYWIEYFRKWFVGMVANAMIEDRCANHVCLVLTGDKQGQFKTTWLDNLCPPSLKEYLITGKIDPEDSKEMNMLISTKLLIHIDDQLKELNRKNENILKSYITVNRAEYRRPYATYPIIKPHFASFCATMNGKDFLTDPSGSRRFLPFEVVEIDINRAQAFNLDKVYAQAYHLFETGFRYWFDQSEIALINENNEAFKVYSAEYELISEFFSPVAKDDFKSYYALHKFMTATKIKDYLEQHSRQKLHDKRVGQALRELNFYREGRKVNNKTIYGYLVETKEGTELENQFKAPEPDPF